MTSNYPLTQIKSRLEGIIEAAKKCLKRRENGSKNGLAYVN